MLAAVVIRLFYVVVQLSLKEVEDEDSVSDSRDLHLVARDSLSRGSLP